MKHLFTCCILSLLTASTIQQTPIVVPPFIKMGDIYTDIELDPLSQMRTVVNLTKYSYMNQYTFISLDSDESLPQSDMRYNNEPILYIRKYPV